MDSDLYRLCICRTKGSSRVLEALCECRRAPCGACSLVDPIQNALDMLHFGRVCLLLALPWTETLHRYVIKPEKKKNQD